MVLPYPFFPTLEQGGLQGGDDGAFENVFAAPEVVAFQSGQVATCFFENQRAGGVVPQFLPAVDVNVVAPAGEVAPVERAAAHAADGAEGGERTHAAGEFAGTQVFDFDACDGFAEFFVDGAQGQWCAVEVCAFAAFSVETFAADGVVDDAEFGAAVFDEGDGNGEMGQSVDEVVGAVYGIDDPESVGMRVQFPRVVCSCTLISSPSIGLSINKGRAAAKAVWAARSASLSMEPSSLRCDGVFRKRGMTSVCAMCRTTFCNRCNTFCPCFCGWGAKSYNRVIISVFT